MLAPPFLASRRELALAAAPCAAWAALVVVTVLDAGGAFQASAAALAAAIPLALLAIGAALVAAGVLPAPRFPRALWAALACFAVWAGVAFASLAWSLSAQLSWLDAARVLAAGAAVAAGAWFGSTVVRPVQAACVTLVAVAVPVLGWAIVQRSFERFAVGQATPRLSQPFGYANALGIFCVLVALPALWLATRRHPGARAVGGGVLGLSLFALLLTGSRGSLLCLLVAVGLWAWLQRRRAESALALAAAAVAVAPAAAWAFTVPALNQQVPGVQPAAGAGLLVAAIAVVAIAAVLVPLVQGPVARLDEQRYAQAERATWLAAGGIGLLVVLAFVVRQGGPAPAVRTLWRGLAGHQEVGNGANRLFSVSSNLRSVWWREAWDSFTQRPLQGHGAGTFRIVDALVRPQTQTPGVEPHNAALQVLSGLGVAGGLAALGALASCTAAAILGVRRARGEERAAAVALLAGLAAFALHNQLDWDWDFYSLTLAAYPLVGVLATAGLLRDVTPRRARAPAAFAVPVLVLAAVVVLLPYLSALARYRAESNETTGLEAPSALLRDQSLEAGLVETDLALGFEPVSYDALLDQARLLVELRRPRQALAVLDRAARLEPRSPAAFYQRGKVEQNLGRHDRACAAFRKAYLYSGRAPALLDGCG